MSAANFANGQLRAIVERIERLEEEKAALATDIKEVYGEAKSNGFDTKTLRAVIRLRKQEPSERQEQEALLDLYKEALGMLVDTPLGDAAVAAATRDVSEDVKRAARSPGVRKAIKALGTPVPLTEEEKANGVTAAFVKNGTRMSIGVGGKPFSPAAQAAADLSGK